jgi:nitrogen-specific signal transduction histidine kinase
MKTSIEFEAADMARLTRPLPHLERAGQGQQALAMADLQCHAAFAALDRLALAVILLAGDSRIVFANTAADALLRAGEAVTAPRGRLTVHDAPAAPALQHAIKSAALINGGHAADPGVIMQVRRPDKRPLSVLVAPLAASRPVRLLTDAAIIVFITDPDRQRRLPLATLASLYRLTPPRGA